MKKIILNLLRRACGTSHLINEIEQLKNIIHDKNLFAEQLACQINCNLLQQMIKTDVYNFTLRSSDKPLSLYASKNGLSFLPQEGNESLPELVIVTMPKSGTYFWGKILQEMGY